MSNNFGAPLDEDELKSMLIDSKTTIPTDQVQCWIHLKLLMKNAIGKFNSELTESSIDDSLPIILLGFSKGCVVLNQLCHELLAFKDSALRGSLNKFQLQDFKLNVKCFIWLDGGHSGSAKAWITDENVLKEMKQLELKCLVYITPYQLIKLRHVEEYNKFIEIARKLDLKLTHKLYYQDYQSGDQETQLKMHFDLLNNFEILEIG